MHRGCVSANPKMAREQREARVGLAPTKADGVGRILAADKSHGVEFAIGGAGTMN